MIRNKFICEVDINLDMEYITNLVNDKKYQSIDGRASHHRFVKDDPYMTSIQKRYPLLSMVYNIYSLPARKEIPLHIDTDRSCAFNIPIQDTENTYTVFYEQDGPLETVYDTNRIYDLVKSPVLEVYRHTLIKPLIINNSIPHKVTNEKDTMRVTLSWSLHKGVTFNQAIECFNE
jgi:hypothetical protein